MAPLLSSAAFYRLIVLLQMLKMDVVFTRRQHNDAYHFDAMYCKATHTVTIVPIPMFMNLVYNYKFDAVYNDRFILNIYRLQGGEKCAEYRGFKQ